MNPLDLAFIDEFLLVNPKMSNHTNDYAINAFETFIHQNHSSYAEQYRFGIKIHFGRNYEGILGILINYHMICAILVLLASINFLFEPRDTNRSCMLIALILVLATFFSAAQVNLFSQNIACFKILKI